jgi:hypothetical protein
MGIFNIFQSKDSLKRKIKTIEENIKKTVSIFCNENFSVIQYGAYDINPKHLVFWICVDTDKIKKELESNIELNNQLRSLLVKYEYPKEAVDSVYIGFESQETVERESKGDWYLHFK